MNNWFHIPIAQKPIFVLFLSAGVLFDDAFSLWVYFSKKKPVSDYSLSRQSRFFSYILIKHKIKNRRQKFSPFPRNKTLGYYLKKKDSLIYAHLIKPYAWGTYNNIEDFEK